MQSGRCSRDRWDANQYDKQPGKLKKPKMYYSYPFKSLIVPAKQVNIAITPADKIQCNYQSNDTLNH
jgi:hypothetical protein